MKEEILKKEVLRIKKQFAEFGIDSTNLIYFPEVPMCGVDKSYVIEERFGMKVAHIIGTEED